MFILNRFATKILQRFFRGGGLAVTNYNAWPLAAFVLCWKLLSIVNFTRPGSSSKWTFSSTVGLQKMQQFKDPLLRGRKILELLSL